MTRFISQHRAESVRNSCLSRRIADKAIVAFRTGKDRDGSAWAGHVVKLFKDGRFIGHADINGALVVPQVPIYQN